MSNELSRMTGEDRVDHCAWCGVEPFPVDHRRDFMDDEYIPICPSCGEDLDPGQCDSCGTHDTPLRYFKPTNVGIEGGFCWECQQKGAHR